MALIAGAVNVIYFVTSRRLVAVAVIAGLVALGLMIYAIVSPPRPPMPPMPTATANFFDINTNTDILVGLWLALGGAIAVVGASLGLAFSSAESMPAMGKRCLDCAKRVPSAARVCRYCGYRFTS